MSAKISMKGNKLIDQFAPEITEMCRQEYLATIRDSIELKYHSSWDWLMPVCKKCVEVIGIYCVTHEDNNKAKVWYKASERISRALSSVDIISAHSEIRNLITWYNQQK